MSSNKFNGDYQLKYILLSVFIAVFICSIFVCIKHSNNKIEPRKAGNTPVKNTSTIGSVYNEGPAWLENTQETFGKFSKRYHSTKIEQKTKNKEVKSTNNSTTDTQSSLSSTESTQTTETTQTTEKVQATEVTKSTQITGTT